MHTIHCDLVVSNIHCPCMHTTHCMVFKVPVATTEWMSKHAGKGYTGVPCHGRACYSVHFSSLLLLIAARREEKHAW